MKVINAKNWDLTPAADGRRYSKYPDGTLPAADPAVWNLPAIISINAGESRGIRQYAQDSSGWAIGITGLPAGASYNASTETIDVTSGASSGSETATFDLTKESETTVSSTATVTLVAVTEGVPAATNTSTFTAGETFIATSTTGTVDLSSVAPGSIVSLRGGNRGILRINNLQGTAANPILLRNNPADSSRVVFTRTGTAGNFYFRLDNCHHVIVDGLFKWSGAASGLTYGIACVCGTGDRPDGGFFYTNQCTDIKTRGVEIDGKWDFTSPRSIGVGIGFHIKQLDAAHPWRIKNMTYEYCYSHKTHGEGFYLGDNYISTYARLENMRVVHCRVEDSGRENLQCKGVLYGQSEIAYNVLLRGGTRNEDSGQKEGLSVTDSMGRWDIHSNIVGTAADAGIHVYNYRLGNSLAFDTSNVNVYNNVIYDCCWSGKISSNRASIICTNSSGHYPPIAKVHHNTLVNGKGQIALVSGSTAYDNIIAGFTGTASGGTQTNNRTGTVAAQNFVDQAAKNYRLTLSSPARNSGGASGYPSVDFDGNARPSGSAVDQGAFEYQE